MQFYHEQLSGEVASYKRMLAAAEAEIMDYRNDPRRQLAANVLWEVAGVAEAEWDADTSWYGTNAFHRMTITMKPMELYTFDRRLTGIDELMSINGFELCLDECGFDKWDNTHDYVYYHIDDILRRFRVRISYRSAECKLVPTGEMKPVTKKVCGLVQ